MQQGAGDTTHYLDTQTGTVITVSRTSPDHILELIAARRRQGDQTLLKIHRVNEQDEAEDWRAFLETIRDTKLRKKLQFAWATRDVEVHQGCLWDDFPSEYKRWMAFRTQKIENRLNVWLEENRFSV
ncbi:MAG: UPF0158 family protein [Candidatus Xenobiia bacterium LiM19]